MGGLYPMKEFLVHHFQRRFTDDPRINRLLNRLVSDVKRYTEDQLEHHRRLMQIGMSLSAGKNLDGLFELIVDAARKCTNASGGTVYLMSNDAQTLSFAVVQNEPLNIRMGGTGEKITWPPVPLKSPDGSPNHTNVSAFAALSGEIVNLSDVYNAEGFDFEGTRKFDAQTGYRSKSMLVVPMKDHEKEIIGVLQLINAQDTETGEVISFSIDSQQMTESLASQAAVALTNSRLVQELEILLESFIKTIATAIDEKSHYTGGHIRRVAELTMSIAEKINGVTEGTFADVRFSDNELNELRIAAWLHDVGKITTPDHIMDKNKKLESVCDRIEILKLRFELIKKNYQLARIRRGNEAQVSDESPDDFEDDYIEKLEEDYAFLSSVNFGGEFMADEMIERVQRIAKRQYDVDGRSFPLLTEDEICNLSIRRGTLTDSEREIVNNHARSTYNMLSQLPFPKKLRHVPLYAASHHEKLDGTGYPAKLSREQLSLQARIIAIADIFEALTAKDRPYRKGKTLSEALKIMKFMVQDKHIDPELYTLFLKEKIYLDYGRKELSTQQMDIPDS
jgi:HD-GYP domain-containing protein (c-di-GMP phosphodiesterase class II)